LADWLLSSDLGPLGALPTAPSLSRGFVDVTLGDWGLDGLADVAELLVSELSTNVVRAATSSDGTPRYDADGKLPLLWIRLLSDGSRLTIEVWDTVPAVLGAPIARHPEPDEESGRGLEIIEMLAEDWGWETVPGWSGKKVWAVLKATLLPGRFPMSEGAAWHKADLSAFPADA
jgi:anti-sigma regulatory factor (Ser/Thr protein kinase)